QRRGHVAHRGRRRVSLAGRVRLDQRSVPEAPARLPGRDPLARGGEERRRGKREAELEDGAAAGGVFNRGAAAVGLDDRAHEAEAEAEPALGTTEVTTVEALPDARLLGRGDAGAGVAYSQNGDAVARGGADLDPAAVGGVLDGIVDQVGDGLAQAGGVA